MVKIPSRIIFIIFNSNLYFPNTKNTEYTGITENKSNALEGNPLTVAPRLVILDIFATCWRVENGDQELPKFQ